MRKRFIFAFVLSAVFLFIASVSYAFEYSADTIFTSEGQKMHGKSAVVSPAMNQYCQWCFM